MGKTAVAWVWEDLREAPAGAVSVALVLAVLADDARVSGRDRVMIPDVMLASRTCLSMGQLETYVSWLEERGFVSVVRGITPAGLRYGHYRLAVGEYPKEVVNES